MSMQVTVDPPRKRWRARVAVLGALLLLLGTALRAQEPIVSAHYTCSQTGLDTIEVRMFFQPDSYFMSRTFDFFYTFSDGYYEQSTMYYVIHTIEPASMSIRYVVASIREVLHATDSFKAGMMIDDIAECNVVCAADPTDAGAQFGYSMDNGGNSYPFTLSGSNDAAGLRTILLATPSTDPSLVDTGVDCSYVIRATDLPAGYRLADIEITGAGGDPQIDLDQSRITISPQAEQTFTITFRNQTPVWYVDTSSPSDGPGTAWDNAFHTIQDAVDAAAGGGTVLVNDGVYNAGGATVDGVNYRVALTPGVLVRSVNGPAYTTIAGVGGYGPAAVRCAYLADNTTMAGCTLSGGYTHNDAGTDREKSGGGAWLEPGSRLEDCVVSDCRAYDSGGGVYCNGGGTLRNCAIVDNWSNGHAGGIRSFSGTTLENCTIAGNRAVGTMGGGQFDAGVTLRNTIIYSNTAVSDPNYRIDAGTTIEHCCAPGFSGDGDISSAPEFADATNGDYRLLPTSPCLNTGTNQEWMADATDLEGHPRVTNGTVDMGAYEWHNLVAGFTMTESDGATQVSESATTDTFDVVLDARPYANVVLTVTSADTGETTVAPGSLTFTQADWNTPQTVTVTGVDDNVIDGNQSTDLTVAVDAANSDNSFDALAAQTVAVTTTDDDVAGVTVVESGGATQVAESGTTDTFTVVLDAEPGSDVVITVTSADTSEATVDKATLTFTPANWNTAQTVTVTGVNDALIDGNQSTTVTLAVDDGSSDDDFHALGDQTVTATTTDDDAAGFTVVESAGTTQIAESGTTDTFTLVLDAEPGSDVVITVTSADTGEATVDKATLTFTPANWDTAQTVTVTGVDDTIIDGNQSTTVTLAVDAANSDDDFDALGDQTVTATTTDDDAAGFTVVESAGTTQIAESGATDTFTLVLDAEPASNVVITVTSADPGKATAAPATLTFTPGNWNTAQTVTVTRVDDVLIDGNQSTTVTLAVDDGSSDDDFDALADQTVTIIPVWHVDTNSPSDGPGTAWGNAFHTIQDAVDAAAGGGIVLVNDGVYNAGGAAVDGVNYRVALTPGVLVRSVNGPAYTTIAGVGGYGPSAVRCAYLADNTTMAGCTLSGGYTHNDAGTDREKSGGGAWLEPGSRLEDCVVSGCRAYDSGGGVYCNGGGVVEDCTLVGNRADQAGGKGGGIYFSLGGVARNCTIRNGRGTGGGACCGGGGLLENCLITANGSGGYSGGVESSGGTLRNCAIVDNWSNGHAGGIRSFSGTTLENCTIAGNRAVGNMGGGQFSEGVTLRNTIIDSNTAVGYPDYRVYAGTTIEHCCAPGFSGDGDISSAPEFADATNGDYRLLPTSPCLNTGTNQEWMADATDLEGHPRVTNGTVDMGAYEWHDLVAGFTMTGSDGVMQVSESATTATFDVVLDARPYANVVLTVTSADAGETTVAPAALTFSQADWNTPQTVTVTGVDDNVIDGSRSTDVTVAVDAANSDDSFDALAAQTVAVTTTDDDVAGVTVAESGGETQVLESGTTDAFTVVLDAEPRSNVVITVTSGDTGEATVDKATVTFTPANWNTAQTVTVTGVDDTLVDDNQTTTVTLVVDAANSDDSFDALAARTVVVATIDTDAAPALTLTLTAPRVVMEGGTAQGGILQDLFHVTDAGNTDPRDPSKVWVALLSEAQDGLVRDGAERVLHVGDQVLLAGLQLTYEANTPDVFSSESLSFITWADNGASNVAELEVVVGAVLQDLQLEAGWNLISFKMDPLDADPSVMFPRAGTSRTSIPVWFWDATSKTYSHTEKLMGGIGYWVHGIAHHVLTAVPGSPTANVVIPAPAGWCMVGPVGSGTGSTLPGAESGVGTPVWTWNSLAQRYEAAQSMATGMGYCVYCRTATEIDLGTE